MLVTQALFPSSHLVSPLEHDKLFEMCATRAFQNADNAKFLAILNEKQSTHMVTLTGARFFARLLLSVFAQIDFASKESTSLIKVTTNFVQIISGTCLHVRIT